MPDQDDKCSKCNWSWDNLNATEDMKKGHCYMFQNKMDKCGKFRTIPPKSTTVLL
jgi:hypothetical protein